MEDENNLSITPRFGIKISETKSSDETYKKKLAKTEKYSKYPNPKRSKSKNKSSAKKKTKNKFPKEKDLNSKNCCKEFLQKKFKLRNDFDHEHSESFLWDKEIALENVELTDKIYD